MSEIDGSDIDFSAWRTFEHTGWEGAAGAYADRFGPVTRTAVEPLLDAARVTAGAQVLDVACGPGYAAAGAGARGAFVIGVDFSERMIERAWWTYPAIQFRKADAEALPFSDAIFDAVVTNFGLLHFGNPDKALSEAHRVLVSGGRVAFTVWRVDDPAQGFGLIYDAIQRYADLSSVPMPSGAPYARFADPSEARRTLEEVGYTDVESRTVALNWRLDDSEELYDALIHGAVRTAAILRSQTEAAQMHIRQHFRDGLSPFRARGAIEFPMPVALTSAARR